MAKEEDDIINDPLLEEVCKRVAEEEQGIFEQNMDAVKAIEMAYKVLKEVSRGGGIKVELHLNDPFPSMGYISIEAKRIYFDRPFIGVVVAIGRGASNINVYPKTNGKVHIDFTYHGIARKINSGGARVSW